MGALGLESRRVLSFPDGKVSDREGEEPEGFGAASGAQGHHPGQFGRLLFFVGRCSSR